MSKPVIDFMIAETLRKFRGKLKFFEKAMSHERARMTIDWFMYGSKLPKSKGETVKWKRYT